MNFRDLDELCQHYLDGMINQHEFLIKLFDVLSRESEESINNFATAIQLIAKLQNREIQ